jgi:hypothetical protein
MGKSTINGPFSIAMFVCQRVNLVFVHKGVYPFTFPKNKQISNINALFFLVGIENLRAITVFIDPFHFVLDKHMDT